MTPRRSRKYCKRTKITHSGHYPKGSARNEIKLRSLHIYQYGIEGDHDIPKLTIHHTLKGEHQYIDTYLADQNDVINTRRLGISGVIDIFHQRKEYPVDHPYDELTFNGNTSHVRDGLYYIDDYHGEIKPTYNFNTYRAALMDDIYKSNHVHGTKRMHTLVNWLTDKSVAFPYGNMAQKRYGYLEALDGYYIKCAHCDCLTYLPLSTLLPPTITRAQLTQFLREFRDQRECYMPDPEIFGDMAMMVPMCFSTSNGNCFNCDEDLFTETVKMAYAIYSESFAYHNVIRGTQIEEMTKMNMLQGAPPDDMPAALSKYNELHNRHAAKALAKMNINHLNTIYTINDMTRTEMMSTRSHLHITSTARINTTPMTSLESEEILLIGDLASATVGNLVHHPSTLVVNASLLHICDTICNGPYFADTGITVNVPMSVENYLEVIPAQHSFDKLINWAIDGAYIMLLRPDVSDIIVKQDASYYYTIATGTDVLVKWDVHAHALLANSAKYFDGANYFNIQTITHGSHLQIVKLVPADNTWHARTLGNKPTFEALIPVFDPINPLATLGVFGTKWEYKTINIELLRRIVTFALTADKSSSAIEAYFAGILSTHYTIGGKVVDLTNTPITEGLPELIYAMMILTNRKLVTMWSSILHLNNFSSSNGLETLTKFFLSRLVKVSVQIADKVLPWFSGVLSKPTEFAKRLLSSKHPIDVDSVFAKLLPLLIITKQSDNTEPIAPPLHVLDSAICHHHSSSCNHSIGDVRCVCCGIMNANAVCACCVQHVKCRHSCQHKCTGNLHACKSCMNNKPCNTKARCACCNVYGCQPCPACPIMEPMQLHDVQPSSKMSIVTRLANNAMKVPVAHQQPKTITPAVQRPNLGHDALMNVPKGGAVFKPNETAHRMMTDYLQITRPEHIFIIDNSDLYIPMLSFTGQYYVPIQLPNPVVSNPIHGEHYCAYACIAEQSNYTVQMLKNMHGDRHSMDVVELRHLLKILSLNCLLILNDTHAEILRNGPQANNYILIGHGSITDEVPHAHWFVPHIPKFTDMPTGYYGPHNFGQPFEDFTNFNMWNATTTEMARIQQRLKVLRSQVRHSDKLGDLALPKVRLIKNVFYLTNGDEHTPRLGKIHLPLPEFVDEELVDALNGVDSKLVKSLYANQTNEWSQVRQDAINMFKLRCCDINQLLVSDEALMSPLQSYSTTVDSDEPFVPVHLLNRVKPLDIVILKKGTQTHTCVVAGDARQPCVRNPYGSGVTLYICKTSLSSLYRNLIMCVKAINNLDNIRSVEFGDVVDGVAGSGKTTLLRNLTNRDKATLVCKTRSAIESHYDSSFHTLMTMEAAGMSHIVTNILVIDEASMITNVELLCCLDNPNMLVHMMGDSMQIGVKDMSNVLGNRKENSLLAQLANTKLYHTYRFGQPLVDKMLKQFVPNITCEPNVHTELTQVTASSYDEIVQLTNNYKVDAVYVFMDADYVQLLEILGDKIAVNKVHASQGKEFDNVLVVHWGNFQVETSIVKSSKFLFTAATRARKHLIWVTPKTVNINVSKIMDIAYIGSGYESPHLFDVNECRLLRPMTELEMGLIETILSNHPSAIEANSKFTIRKSSITVEAQVKKWLTNINISFTVDRLGTHGNNLASRTAIDSIKDGIRANFPAGFAQLESRISEIMSYSETSSGITSDEENAIGTLYDADAEPVDTNTHTVSYHSYNISIDETEQFATPPRPDTVRASDDRPVPMPLSGASPQIFEAESERLRKYLDDVEQQRLSAAPTISAAALKNTAQATTLLQEALGDASIAEALPTHMQPILTDDHNPTDSAVATVLTKQLAHMVRSLPRDTRGTQPTPVGAVLSTDLAEPIQQCLDTRAFGILYKLQVKHMHLTAQLWSRMIILADIVLSYQCTSTALTWKHQGHLFKLSIFGGCSLYCGFKFEYDDDTVLISSAHADDTRDHLLNTLNTCNRHITGTTEGIVRVISFLSDDTLFGSVPRNTCFKTYVERLTNICGGVLTDCSFDSVGTRFQTENTSRAISCDSYSDSFIIPTHQRVEHYIVTTSDGIRLEPCNVIVHTAKQLVQLFSGIRGTDADFTLSRANKATLEKTMIRHLNAEEKFDRPVNIPTQLVRSELWQTFMQQVGSNVITPIAIGTTAVSSIHGAMLMSALMLRQMFADEPIHYIGLNAQLFCLNYVVGDTISEIPGDGAVYIRQMMSAKAAAIAALIEGESDADELKRLQDELAIVSDYRAIVASPVRKLTICHPKYFNRYHSNRVFTCYPYTTDPTCIVQDGKLLEASEDGGSFEVSLDNTVIIGVVGSYYMHKHVEKLPEITLQSSGIANPNYRVFASNVPGMETVSIPDTIFRRLVARAFADADTKLPDMIAYSRSLLNTMTYTSKGYSFKYNDNPLELLQFSIVALNFANRQRKVTGFVNSVLGLGVDTDKSSSYSPIINLLVESLKTIGLNLMQNQFNQPLQILHEMLNRGTMETPVISDIFAVLRDANYQEIYPSIRLKYRHSERSNQTVNSDTAANDNDVDSHPNTDAGDTTDVQTTPAVAPTPKPDKGKGPALPDNSEYASSSQTQQIAKFFSDKVITTWHDMHEAWNKYVKSNNQYQPWEFNTHVGDVLLLYAGSRGDAQPLDAIAEVAVAGGLSVRSLIPADLHSRIPGVHYIEYCDSYDALTTCGVNGTIPDASTFMTHAMDVYRHWLKEHMRHRIVIGMFFSSEANLVHGTEKNIRIIPQLDDEWDGAAKCNHGMSSNSIRKFFKLPKPVITPYWAVPYDILNRADNLGFLVPKYCLNIDNNTDMAIRFSIKHNGQVRVVTLGSMIPDDYLVRINNMLLASPLPVILVTSKLHNKSDKFDYDGQTFALNMPGMYKSICIVPSVNYLALNNRIVEAHHHCGAGTYLTFRMLGVKQVPYAVAFDQHYNAWHYNKDAVDSADKPPTSMSVEEQLNRSIRDVQQMLDIHGAVTNIKLVDPTALGEIPFVERPIDTNIVVKPVILRGVKTIKNTYIDNCVFNVLLDCMQDDPACARLVDAACATHTFMVPEDVIEFLLTMPCNFAITFRNTSLICDKKLNVNVRISITDDLSHAEEFTFDSYEEVAHATSDAFNDLIISGDYTRDVQTVVESISTLEPINFDKVRHSLVLTSMRKLRPLELFNGASGLAHITSSKRLSAGYVYACLTSAGLVQALCVPSLNGNSMLVHMQPVMYNCAVIIRLNKLIDIPVGAKRSLIKTTNLVAINHATSLQLQTRGIFVSSVAQPQADTLYIYDTWARKHHFEAEQETIRTAKRIMAVPESKDKPLTDITPQKPTLLSKAYPVCIAKGKFYFRCESANRATNDILNSLKFCSKLTDGLYLLPYKSKWTTLFTILFKYDGTKIEYCNTVSVDPPTNLQELYDFTKVDTMAVKLRLENLSKQHGYTSMAECRIEQVTTMHTIETYSLAVRQKLHIEVDHLITGANGWTFRIAKQGAGFVQFDEIHIPELEDSKFNNSKFATPLQPTPSTTLTQDMTALIPLDGKDLSNNFVYKQTLNYHAKENQLISVGNVTSLGLEVDAIKYDEIPQSQVIDFWNNSELLDSNIILPTNAQFTVRSRIQPIRIKSNAYLLMEAYPKFARPSRSKAFAEELNSITNRHGAYTVFRKTDLDTKQEVQFLIDNYFTKDYKSILAEFQNQPITFSPAKAQAWIDKHNMPKKVRADVMEMLATGWEKTPINAMSVHGKTEQTTKMKTTRWFDDVVTRSIVAAPYAVSALFADIFLETKQRLKAVLGPKIFYSDGSTPLDLAAVIRSSDDFTYCVEDDLTQQDRQVDHQLIAVEMELYRLLGVDGNVLAFYRMCHEKWSWKGHGISGVWDAMRLSGQVTTALGNAITNMIVHNRFMLRNQNRISKMLFLGDDIIFLMKQEVNISKHGTETKELYNMQSKIISRKYVGGFISMIVYNINGDVGICPHFKRMRHRFSVCNYTYPVDDTDSKVQSRVLSYLFMLGKTKWTTDLVAKMGYSVSLPEWYHTNTAITANALYDETEEWVVRSHISALRHMLEKQVVKRHKFLTWSSV
ncbi:polyprotein [Grapevine endophyte alphaendornavirus]|uniref:Polyprotein n=1 Tax=Grapevine endophyte alphaendornavirus TaxID=1249676 RepID=K7RTN4_9VIRU|nr:polyprotein [Grapevine endophyte alphaendornavirus]AFV91541.1 polyprotein [Grapevine endophyte alphaendornavirus]